MMTDRKNYIDFLRVVCMLGVVYIHVVGYQSNACFSDCRYLGYLLDFFAGMSVPLFFMISGALLLHKIEDLKKLYGKRLMRFSLVLLVISLIQWGIASFYCSNISVKDIFFACIGAKPIPYVNFWAIWFLYVYILTLIFLPFMQFLAKSLTNKGFVYLIILQFAMVCCIPSLHNFLGDGNSDVFIYKITPFQKAQLFPYTPIYAAFFFMLGYYAEHRVKISRKMMLLWASLTITLLLLSPKLLEFLDWCDFISIPCLFIYLLVKHLWNTSSLNTYQFWTTFGGGAFTVMLTENIFRLFAQPYIEALFPQDYHLLSLFTVVFITWGVCLILGMVLKQIPIIKQYV